MSSHDLTGNEWNAMRDFFPARFSGRPVRPRRCLPEEYGSWQAAYNRLRRWINNDLWDQVYAALLHQADACGNFVRSLCCGDALVIRAYRCASGMLPKNVEDAEMNALGRPRGAFSV